MVGSYLFKKRFITQDKDEKIVEWTLFKHFREGERKGQFGVVFEKKIPFLKITYLSLKITQNVLIFSKNGT